MGFGMEDAIAMVDDALGDAERSDGHRTRVAGVLLDFSSWWGDRDAPPGEADMVSFLNERNGTTSTLLSDPVEGNRAKSDRRALFLLLQAIGGSVDANATIDSIRPPKCPGRFLPLLEAYASDCEGRGNAPDTVSSKREAASLFLLYVDPLVADLRDLGPQEVIGYFLSLSGKRRKTVATIATDVRDLLRYCGSRGLCPAGLDERVPRAHVVRNETVPHLWTADEVASVVGAIDRSSAIGKRDYAFILLVARLGLRTSDVRKLKMSAIDWRRKEIRITQSKTGIPLTLPLLDDVGWAIIDYLREGRPETPGPLVFVSHRHPYGELGGNSSFVARLYKYAKRAGVEFEDGTLHGLHSLRGALARTMLEGGATLAAVSQTLGHASPDTTVGYYLRLDVEGLRDLALDVEDVLCGGEEG